MHAALQTMRLRLLGQGAARAHGAAIDRLLGATDWAEIRAILQQRAGMASAGRPLTQRNPGEGRSVFIARGMDYAESRPYQPGDDMRSMHWQLLARTGEPHVKLYHEEHAGSWHGLIDIRDTMAFGTRVRTKAQQAARVALLAAGIQALASPQTMIACTLWRAGDLRGRRFGRGSVAVRRLAAWLMAEPMPAVGAKREAAGHAGRADFASWTRLLVRQPSPSRLLLASDWSWGDALADAALWRLAAFADVLAVRVRDPAEVELPALPRSWFEDASDGASGWVEPGQAVRRGYAAAAAKAAEARARALRGAGVPLSEVFTTNNAAEAMQAMASAARLRPATPVGLAAMAPATRATPATDAMPSRADSR